MYLILAWGVDLLHIAVILFLMFGWMFYFTKHVKLRFLYIVFAFGTLPVQFCFGMICPLTVLSVYLRELAEPGSMAYWDMDPFIVRYARIWLGLDVSETLIFIATVSLFILGLASFLVYAIDKRFNINGFKTTDTAKGETP